jgi:hypothetical protein
VKHPYNASKAWHHGSELATDLEQIVQHLTRHGRYELGREVQLTSVSVHRWLEDSHTHDDLTLRLHCYQKARNAVHQLLADLEEAYSFRYIDRLLYEQFSGRAITIHRLLSELIRTTKQQTE